LFDSRLHYTAGVVNVGMFQCTCEYERWISWFPSLCIQPALVIRTGRWRPSPAYSAVRSQSVDASYRLSATYFSYIILFSIAYRLTPFHLSLNHLVNLIDGSSGLDSLSRIVQYWTEDVLSFTESV